MPNVSSENGTVSQNPEQKITNAAWVLRIIIAFLFSQHDEVISDGMRKLSDGENMSQSADFFGCSGIYGRWGIFPLVFGQDIPLFWHVPTIDGGIYFRHAQAASNVLAAPSKSNRIPKICSSILIVPMIRRKFLLPIQRSQQ